MPYRIQPAVIEKIKKHEVRQALVQELGRTDGSLLRLMRVNEWNGILTTCGAVTVMMRMTKLHPLEILEFVEGKQIHPDKETSEFMRLLSGRK